MDKPNNRLEAFNNLSSHPWHRKSFTKLSKSDLAWCREFITAGDQMTHAEFRAKVHFLGLDQEPKIKTEIVELLSAANSISESK